jgi:TetR/AcrR family transcriptional regulator, cholesterol catabolism regulator
VPVKERILENAVELFWRYGVKSVTMEDIAKELGISKKTIYQHFADKDAIVEQVIEKELDCEKTDIERMESEASDPIQEVIMASVYMRAKLGTMSPALLYDLKKYHPKAWNLFQKHKQEHIIHSVSDNLRRGIQQRLYRNDIHVDVLARLRIEQIEMAFDNTIFPHASFSMIDIQIEFMHHFLRGILTEDGFKLYNTYTDKIAIESNNP